MKQFSRRQLIISITGILATAPAVRIAILWSKDNLLPAVSTPHLVLIDGWLLDENDGKALSGSA